MSLIKFPKDDKTYRWTSHIKGKMVFYGLSPQKILTVLKSPDRKEEGIALDTLAVMKRNDTPKRKQEIWVMYAVGPSESTSKKFNVKSSKRVMISAWRYPGKSKPGKQIPIPDDILMEIKEWFGPAHHK